MIGQMPISRHLMAMNDGPQATVVLVGLGSVIRFAERSIRLDPEETATMGRRCAEVGASGRSASLNYITDDRGGGSELASFRPGSLMGLAHEIRARQAFAGGGQLLDSGMAIFTVLPACPEVTWGGNNPAGEALFSLRAARSGLGADLRWRTDGSASFHLGATGCHVTAAALNQALNGDPGKMFYPYDDSPDSPIVLTHRDVRCLISRLAAGSLVDWLRRI